MSKIKMYLRVGQKSGSTRGSRYRIDASTTPNYHPLVQSQGSRNEREIPTAAFCLVLDVPDELFAIAERELAEVKLSVDDGRVAADVIPLGQRVSA
jgi:hypothetical protein